jgi:hypothetical protein
MSKVAADYKRYRVTGAATPVKVVVQVLHGQVGATAARIGATDLVRDDPHGDRKRWKDKWQFSPGSGKAVAGKMLFITTAVADVRKETDATGVAYQLSGGPDGFAWRLETSVDEAGGVVIYQMTVDFYT